MLCRKRVGKKTGQNKRIWKAIHSFWPRNVDYASAKSVTNKAIFVLFKTQWRLYASFFFLFFLFCSINTIAKRIKLTMLMLFLPSFGRQLWMIKFKVSGGKQLYARVEWKNVGKNWKKKINYIDILLEIECTKNGFNYQVFSGQVSLPIVIMKWL